MKVRFVIDVEINENARLKLDFDSAAGNLVDSLAETARQELAIEFDNDIDAPYNSIATIMAG